MLSISIVETVGFVAAVLTLITFAQKRMLDMRLAALSSNVVFITYGLLGGIYPVLVLHMLLFPINLMRCIAEILGRRTTKKSDYNHRGTPGLCWVYVSMFAPTCTPSR